jgi:predicted ribosome quality control (RQC) complex YloA/Tae2 family protein
MVLNLPLDDCIDNTHTKVTREKRKEKKRNEQKELQQAIESQTKEKSKIT